MAVRAIKVEPDPSVVKRIVCPNCGVTLEYRPNDVKTLTIGKIECDDREVGEEWIVCANKKCGKAVTLSSW